ncbi:MAG TPA: hypothetical protein VGH19_07045 [Verrucomicrobiae bacterium]
MNDVDRKPISEFFEAIKSIASGYNHAVFSYVAFKKGQHFELAKGILQLQGVSLGVPSKHFRSENIEAGLYRLDEIGQTPTSIIDALLTGELKLPSGDLSFPPEESRPHSVYFSPFFSGGTVLQHRQIQLNVYGGRRETVWPPKFDWELRASNTPYDTVQELCGEFGLGALNGDIISVEIIAYNVAGIDTQSRINGSQAHLILNLAHGLEPAKASIGYRLFLGKNVVKRATISGSSMEWSTTEKFQQGIGKLEVPVGAVLNCVSCYNGMAQSHYWVADLDNAQNPFRAVHQAFDSKLDILQELIAKAESKGANARDLELAVAWLLWLLGFSATHIGGTPRTSDGPDLIAATPAGNFLVVECTTGILKENNKLPHLIERTEKVRRSLSASGNQHLKVCPILITTKTREEVKAELDQAYKLGIFVVTRDGFDEIINRTHVVPDADRLYSRIEEVVKRNLETPQQTSLPFK